ncbi:hypothetical protein N665_4220s0001 [Sinapis alba]|nr:hypothetical protein N665_4220s0001 [Sinapis alba]
MSETGSEPISNEENEETGSHSEPVSDEETGSHSEPVSDEETGSHSEPVSDEETGSHSEPVSHEETGSHSEPVSHEETGSHSEPVSHEETGSHSEPVSHEETGSHNEPVSNEEAGYNELESNSTNLPDVDNERHHNAEEGEIAEKEDEEREEEEEEKEKDEEEDRKSERTSSESEEKSNLETLLAIQEKYELYCPRCTSCAPRKVILKKMEHGKPVDLKPYESSDIEEIQPPVKPHVLETLIENDDQKDKKKGDIFTVELLKSTVYGGLTETITSLVVVSSASASGSSTDNILALAVANLAGGLVVLAQNLQDLRNNSDQEKDWYNELLGRRDNIRMHVLVAVLSYIFFGLIAPLVYAFSFYQTGIKNYKLVSVFSVSLFCAIMLGMIKVYVRKPVNVRASPKLYLKSAAYYTSIVVVSSGISYIVGEIVGEYIRKLGWFSLYQTSLTSTFEGIKSDEYRFTSF